MAKKRTNTQRRSPVFGMFVRQYWKRCWAPKGAAKATVDPFFVFMLFIILFVYFLLFMAAFYTTYLGWGLLVAAIVWGIWYFLTKKQRVIASKHKRNNDLVYRCIMCDHVTYITPSKDYFTADPRCAKCKSLLNDQSLLNKPFQFSEFLRNNFGHVLALSFILLNFLDVLGKTISVSGTTFWFQVTFAYLLALLFQKQS